jgi:hypothetical protein
VQPPTLAIVPRPLPPEVVSLNWVVRSSPQLLAWPPSGLLPAPPPTLRLPPGRWLPHKAAALAWLRCDEDWWRGEIFLELLKGSVRLRGPLNGPRLLQQLEEG